MHRVAAGDTLAGIGKRYGVAVSGIVSLNNLPSSGAEEGDRLVIPATLPAEPPARRAASAAAKKAPAHRQASAKSSPSTAPRKSASTSAKSAAPAAKSNASAPAKTSASKPSLTAAARTFNTQALVAQTGTR